MRSLAWARQTRRLSKYGASAFNLLSGRVETSRSASCKSNVLPITAWLRDRRSLFICKCNTRSLVSFVSASGGGDSARIFGYKDHRDEGNLVRHTRKPTLEDSGGQDVLGEGEAVLLRADAVTDWSFQTSWLPIDGGISLPLERSASSTTHFFLLGAHRKIGSFGTQIQQTPVE